MYKVLWITNSMLPEPQRVLFPNSTVAGSGGWVSSLLEDLSRTGMLCISVLLFSPKLKKSHHIEGEFADYYIYPHRGFSNPSKYNSIVYEIKEAVNPDIVHIHGAEFPYGLSYVNTNGNKNVVVSIQGLISVIAERYTDGLSIGDILRNITVRDMIWGSILSEKREYRKRGAMEVELLKKVKHVMGRTEFDYAHTLSINPTVNYSYCGESLRPAFYNSIWEYEKCIKHRIYVSQSNYPVKGLHQLLRALSIVKNNYPDVSLHIAGTDITKRDSFNDLKNYTGYGAIVKELINKCGIKDNVRFMGLLSAAEVVREMLESNLYVCPSSNENSSNSLAEAQCLGVPCLASYVGGIPSLINTPEMGQVYNFFDVEMLAKKICDCFKSSSFNNQMVVTEARRRHDKLTITEKVLEIYQSIARQ